MVKKIFFVAMFFLLSVAGIGLAQEKLSLPLVREKVEAAAKLIAEEGEGAFPKLRDPYGPFRFAEGKGYVWIHDMRGVMTLHPISPELEGQNMIAYKDSSGFELFVAMNNLAKKHGSGWVVYLWPKPGKKYEELKGSYVKLVTIDGKEYVLGCGMYDINRDYIKTVFPQDIIYDASSRMD